MCICSQYRLKPIKISLVFISLRILSYNIQLFSIPFTLEPLSRYNSTKETNNDQKGMEQFNRLIDKLRLLPIAHIDKVSSPSDIRHQYQKVDKFKELILYINLLSTSGYKLELSKQRNQSDGDDINWFFQQFKTVEKKLNEEILTYNKEGIVIVEIIFESVNKKLTHISKFYFKGLPTLGGSCIKLGGIAEVSQNENKYIYEYIYTDHNYLIIKHIIIIYFCCIC